MTELRDRWPATQNHLRWLRANPKLEGVPLQIARVFEGVAREMVNGLPDSPELNAGFRHLLEAKDCFIRAALTEYEDDRADG